MVKEGVEGPRDDVGRHASAGIGDAKRQILPRWQVPLPGRVLVHPLVRGLDRDPPAVRHGVAGIDAEVQQGVLELGRIDLRCPQANHVDGLDRDLRTDCASDEIGYADDEFGDVGGLRIERLSAREGEKAVRQSRGTSGRALSRDDVAIEVIDPTLRHPPSAGDPSCP